MHWLLSATAAMLCLLMLTGRARGDEAAPAPPPALVMHTELVRAGLSGIHGWNSCRLVRYQGELYASGILPALPGAPDDKPFSTIHTEFLHRRPNGTWGLLGGVVPFNLYSMLMGPDGRLWAIGNQGYTDITVYRSREPLDPGSLEPLYTGTCAYSGAAISPEGNFLLMHAETMNGTAFVANAVVAAFYDHETDQWYTSRLPTPDGKYGYEGIVVRGRQAIAVLNLATSDPQANPIPPNYSWRHLRLAVCHDLTKGEWIMRPWLMPQFGTTCLQDMIVAPDGEVYLSFTYRSGGTFEEMNAQPSGHYVAHLRDDGWAELFPTGLLLGEGNGASHLYVDSRGQWYLLGRVPGSFTLHLWTLDPTRGFRPGREWVLPVLPGSAVLEGYIIHTLRPEHFGGETDGDTIHLLSSRGQAEATEMWHAWFELPVGR